jgi:isochorismate synthase
VQSVTRRLDRRDIDLLDETGREGMLFVRAGEGLAAWGEAWRGPLDRARHVLADIDADDAVGEPGCGPVAFAALPFDPDAPCEAVIPATVFGCGPDGRRWITTVDGGASITDHNPPVVTGADFTIASDRDPVEWCAAVAAGRDAAKQGEIDKVVLARAVTVTSSQTIDRWGVLRRLRATFGSSYVFSLDGLVGASPELLVARRGDVVRSHPLAGTVPRTGDPDVDARLAAGLLASAKDQHEHRITIDAVHDRLLGFSSWIDEEPEPSIVTVANVQHLGTRVEGRLTSPAAHVVDLVRALHPTPAIGGSPTDRALALIADLEQLDRGRYAGAIGWFDRHGNGTFAVTIRCAEIVGATARLFAGVGVVADSDPEAELAETQAKFQAMLSAILRP